MIMIKVLMKSVISDLNVLAQGDTAFGWCDYQKRIVKKKA